MSGAQLISRIAWLSVLALPWYLIATDTSPRSPAVVLAFGVWVLVGLIAALWHNGEMTLRRRDQLRIATTTSAGSTSARVVFHDTWRDDPPSAEPERVKP